MVCIEVCESQIGQKPPEETDFDTLGCTLSPPAAFTFLKWSTFTRLPGEESKTQGDTPDRLQIKRITSKKGGDRKEAKPGRDDEGIEEKLSRDNGFHFPNNSQKLRLLHPKRQMYIKLTLLAM